MAEKSPFEDLEDKLVRASLAYGDEKFLACLLQDRLIALVARYKPVVLFWRGSDCLEIGFENESDRNLFLMYRCKADTGAEEKRERLDARKAAILMMQIQETHDGVLKRIREAMVNFIRTFEADR